MLGAGRRRGRAPASELLGTLAQRLGPRGFTTAAQDMEPWVTDWRGRIQGRAAALLSPGSTDEVQDVVRLAAAAGVSIVPQGGNTSLVGGATPPEDGACLLLSLRRMRAIRSLSLEDNVVVAEAGVVLADLHAAAEAQGRRFPLNLAARGSATVGGLVSTNAGGTQVLRFGTMRALVLGIEAILPSAERFDGLSALHKDNRGYDLRQLLIGAEGTLGVVTAASLRLAPPIGVRALAWVGLHQACRALELLGRLQGRMSDLLESFEIIPAEALTLVLRNVPGTRAPLASSHVWNVLVEIAAQPGAQDPGPALQTVLEDAMAAGLIEDAVVAVSESQADALWKLRESISEAERVGGVSAKHDVSVPVSAMPTFLDEAREAVEARFPGSRVLAFGHLGDGNVHFNVRAPAGTDDRAWMAAHESALNAFVNDFVCEAGGSISAEHGIGQSKVKEFMRTAGAVRLGALRAIKTAIDPQGLMNPGKLLATEPD